MRWTIALHLPGNGLRWALDVLRTDPERRRVVLGLSAITAFALLLRLTYLYFSWRQLGTDGLWTIAYDTQNYLAIAQDFLDGTSAAERYLFIFGPGYGLFLAGCLAVFGHTPLPILFLQICLSVLCCPLMYLLARSLGCTKAVALLAAALAAVSYTSISLATVLLSETLFVFLFLLSLVSFVRALRSHRGMLLLACTACTVGAILVRSVAQFWPLVVLVITILYIRTTGRHQSPPRRTSRRLAVTVTVTVLTIGLVEAGWIVHNQRLYGVAAMTSAAHGGLANLAAYGMKKIESRPYREIRDEWNRRYLPALGDSLNDYEKGFAADQALFIYVLSQHPWQLVAAYFDLTWENVNSINYLPRLQLPDWPWLVKATEHVLKDFDLNYLPFWLSLTGIVIMVVKRQYWAAGVLGLTYIYFAASTGVTRWQGSRLFFPAHIAQDILMAVALVATVTRGPTLVRRVWWRATQGSSR